MARCSTVGCRPCATYRQPRPSSDEPLNRPVVLPSTSSPTLRRFTRAPSAPGRPTPSTTATGFYNRVISTNRCERNHGYVKARLRPMRGLKSVDCAKHLFPALDADAIDRAWLRRCVAYRAAARRRTDLCGCPQHCRRCGSAGTRRIGTGHERAKDGSPAHPTRTGSTLMSENRCGGTDTQPALPPVVTPR